MHTDNVLRSVAGGGGIALRVSQSKAAFVQACYREHAKPLVSYLTSRFHSREDAEEIAQEAWLKFYGLTDPASLDNPRGYLFQIATNVGIDRARRRILEQRHDKLEEQMGETESPSAERDAAAREEMRAINDALKTLPEKCRQVFVMHRLRGASYPEIAQELDVSVSMVEKHIIRALRHFRAAL